VHAEAATELVGRSFVQTVNQHSRSAHFSFAACITLQNTDSVLNEGNVNIAEFDIAGLHVIELLKPGPFRHKPCARLASWIHEGDDPGVFAVIDDAVDEVSMIQAERLLPEVVIDSLIFTILALLVRIG